MKNVFLAIIGISLLASVISVTPYLLPAPGPLCEGCNVILISLDTFAAKHSDVHTPGISTTPFLEELAGQSIVFEQAYVQAPWTLPSHASMLTGVYPWDLGVWNLRDPLPLEAFTIAEALQRDSYATAAFSVGLFVEPLMQFDQGFDEFHSTTDLAAWNDMPSILNDTFPFIETHHNDKPFFLFVRSFHLHDPNGTDENEVTIRDIVSVNTDSSLNTAATRERFREAYHHDIREVDAALESFFEKLEETGALENTVVIITSDHGEEFGEHGVVGFHASALYTESVHVPLLITLPSKKSAQIPYSVEIRSLPKTILEILGLPDEPAFDAASLTPFITKEEKDHRLVQALTVHEREPLFAAIEASYRNGFEALTPKSAAEQLTPFTGTYAFSTLKGPWHVIKNHDDSIELYALDNDPDEQNDLFPTLSKTTETLSFSDKVLVKELIDLVSHDPR